MSGIAFMFTGAGDQYPGMGAQLYQDEPVFRDGVDRCCRLLSPLLGFDLHTVIYPDVDQPIRTAEPDLCGGCSAGTNPIRRSSRWTVRWRLIRPPSPSASRWPRRCWKPVYGRTR
ncbi:acyltransferase domain-containing protein [Fodinicola feengrottensis]|uniref:acyltransferase domain-containing protein n=1 Tax=Fodinicola feengrottensis TaxID=435914 RepID=UPI0013D01E8A|nr:acyltransferase domain-containing protein [Fodinicola feengrottensis]